MHFLLQLKQYDEYFDMLFEGKRHSDWDNTIKYMSENPDLEDRFKTKIKDENDLANVNFILNKLWGDFKKNSIKENLSENCVNNINDQNKPLHLYTMHVLTNTLEILYTENLTMSKIISESKN